MAKETQPFFDDAIFGSDLPKRIKAKLTARQLLAAHSLEPNQSIQFPFPVRDGDGQEASTMTVQEALGDSDQNFNGDADLSSRTPVVRMWTAVRLMERTDNVKYTTDENEEKTKSEWDPISPIKIYQLGNHQLSTTSPEPINDPIAPGSIDTQGLFPEPQHSQATPNEFLAPPSGITSVTIRMPDPGEDAAVATNKFTTVTFLVNNIHDFNNIYSRYFLTHRANVIVDVAWDTALLYNPLTLMDPELMSGLNRGKSIYEVLFGRDVEGQKDGFVTEANGDMETIMGQVKDFNATYRSDGSIECTVQLHSANKNLMQQSFVSTDKSSTNPGKNFSNQVDQVFNSKLAKAITQTGHEAVAKTALENFPLGSLRDPKNTPPATKAGILENGALRIYPVVIDSSTSNVAGGNVDFLSIGVIEDELLVRFGSSPPKLIGGQTFNSNGAFTKFDESLFSRQASETDYNNLKLLYPDDWGILPPAKKPKHQGQPKSGDEAHTPWTKEQHMESRDRLQPGITRFHIYSDGAAQSQNDIPSDPRIVRTNGSYAVTTDTRPEMNATQPVAKGGNIIGTAPTDAEYTIVSHQTLHNGLWYKIAFPWTGDSLAKAEETYKSVTIKKDPPYVIPLPRLSWDSMNESITYGGTENMGLAGPVDLSSTKPAQVSAGWFWPDTVTEPGTADAILPGDNLNENSYTVSEWADETVFKKKQVGFFVEQQPDEWNGTKITGDTMIDLPRLRDFSAGSVTGGIGPDYRLYVEDPGLFSGNIMIGEDDLPHKVGAPPPQIYWWRFETSQLYPGAYWGQGLPNRYKGWFYPRIFYRQIISEVGLSDEHVGEWKWSLDPRAPFPGGWVPITKRVMQPNRIRVKDAGSGEMVDYDPTQQKVDGVPLTNWLGKEIVGASEPYYEEWQRTRDYSTMVLPRATDQKIAEIFGIHQLKYLLTESRIMVDRENVAIMTALERRTRIAKFESGEKTQTDRLLRSLSVPQPGPHQGWIHWTAGQPIDLPEDTVIVEESKDRFSYAWKAYPEQMKDLKLDPKNEVDQRFKAALRGRSTDKDLKGEGDEFIQQLIPIRELFVNTQVLKNAFSAATDLSDALRRVLNDLNDYGSGAYHFRTANNNSFNSGVTIIDTDPPSPPGPKNLNDLFVFSPYSKNSIVKNLNFQFQTPSDEVTEYQLAQSIAGQGMNSPDEPFRGILPVSEALDKYLTTNLLEQADLLDRQDIQWWSPVNGHDDVPFNSASPFLTPTKLDTSTITDTDKASMNVLFGPTNSYQNQVPNLENETISTLSGDTELTYAAGKALNLPTFTSTPSIASPFQQISVDGIVLKDIETVTKTAAKLEAFVRRTTPTPYNVIFDIYGIASNFGGRHFRMDFIPDRWFSRTYFRCYEQTQTITPETWTTSISAQMITANNFLQPPGKASLPGYTKPTSVYLRRQDLVVDPNTIDFQNLAGWSKLSPLLKKFRIVSHRGEHFSTGPLMDGKLKTDLKDFTALWQLPTLTAKWCSKYIGPNAPQWINDWVYGFYGAHYSPDGNLNLPKNPLKRPKDDWAFGTPEVLMEQRYGRGIPCTSDGRLAHAPPRGRVTGAAGSGDTRYGAGPVSTVSALFDTTRVDGAQKGINVPKDSNVRVVRYHKYWMVYPAEFPIPGNESQTFQLDASKLFSIFMEMTQPAKYK